MIAAVRWRLLLYGCLLLLPLWVGVQVYNGVEQLGREIDSSSDLTVSGDDNVRLEVEYYRMREGFERFVAGDPAIDFDEMMTRFDIVWSRAVGIAQAPTFHRFSAESGILDLSAKLLQVLQIIEPTVDALDRGHDADLVQLRRALEGFEQDLASTSNGFSIRRQHRGVEIRKNLSDLIGQIGRMGLVVSLLVGGVIGIFVLEAVHARRAEFNVRRREERASFLAHHDALTGLANRALLADTLESALDDNRAQQGRLYLLALDLDGFKAVNDTYGHHVGDDLLKVLAHRLVNLFKGTDLVARLGGDEFAIIVRSCESDRIVAEIATRTIAAIEQPVVIGNNAIHISTSIGIASAPDHGDSKEALLRCADVALYESKAAGRRAFRFFHSEMDEMLQRRTHLEAGLRQAIEATNLEVHFQPQVDLRSGEIFGVEALARWTDPTLGPIPPDVFIEIASHCGMMLDLGSWVIETACRRAAFWAEKGITPKVAINLSPLQLYHRNFLPMLDDALRRTGFSGRQLTLEITEDAMVSDSEAAIETLMSIRRRGITLAVDDFGTGYSNLGYLKRLPVQYLKIDRTFIKDIEFDPSDRAIIHGIINLANSLGLKTIAEGVETEQQRQFLLAADCRMAQGFLFQPALPEHEILSCLERTPRWQPWPDRSVLPADQAFAGRTTYG